MRLRTVINELDCTEARTNNESVLNEHVLLTPYTESNVPEGVCLLRLATLSDWQNGSVALADDQLLMVFCGETVPADVALPKNVVLVAHAGSYEDFRMAFLDFPGESVLYQARHESLFDAFTSSYDLAQFARKVQAVLGNPIMIINTDQRVLATSGLTTDSPDIKEVLEKGYLSEAVNEQLAEDGLVEDNRRAHHSVLGNKSRYGTRWVTSIIRYHHLEMGRLDVREQDSRITGFDLELIDFASQLAGVMIERLGAAGEHVGTGSSVLADLIQGTFANDETMRAQLALTQLPKDASYLMLSLRASRNADRELYARAGTIVAPTLHGCLWCALDDCLAVLVPMPKSASAGYDEYDRAEAFLLGNQAFVDSLSNNRLSAYVSEPFDDLSLGTERFGQCRDLMRAPAARPHGVLTLFWDNRFVTIAHAAASQGYTEKMLDKRVVAMANYDREHKTSYLETAISSVRHPGSPAEAAAALNIHRNTYFYRMNKARELFCLDLKDGSDRLAVAFTTAIMEGLDHCDLT